MTTLAEIEPEVLVPESEHEGHIIHRLPDGSLGYFDRDGYLHVRNTKLNERDRLWWIKSDINHYVRNGWMPVAA